jgi:hypothetical protein
MQSASTSVSTTTYIVATQLQPVLRMPEIQPTVLTARSTAGYPAQERPAPVEAGPRSAKAAGVPDAIVTRTSRFEAAPKSLRCNRLTVRSNLIWITHETR